MAAIGEELSRIATWGERHRRLLARLTIVLVATAIVDVLGTVAIFYSERHAPTTEITSFGDALFFTTVQILTVSSQIRNPFTTWGRVVDVGLELWGVLFVAGSTGAIAAFFLQAD